LHHDGATYDESAKAWAVNGNPIDLQKDYKVAMSDFLITGKEFGMSYLIPQHPAVKLVEKPSKDNPADLRLDIRKAFIDYLRKHK
jgi:5'-nucleotidase